MTFYTTTHVAVGGGWSVSSAVTEEGLVSIRLLSAPDPDHRVTFSGRPDVVLGLLWEMMGLVESARTGAQK